MRQVRLCSIALCFTTITAVSTAVVMAYPQKAEAACVNFDKATCTVNYTDPLGLTTIYDIKVSSPSTFFALESTLTTFPIWNNQSLAVSLAGLVGDSLSSGLRNPLGLGPYFAWGTPVNVQGVPRFSSAAFLLDRVSSGANSTRADVPLSFALVSLNPNQPSPISTPEPGTLSAVLLSGLMLLRYSKQGQRD